MRRSISTTGLLVSTSLLLIACPTTGDDSFTTTFSNDDVGTESSTSESGTETEGQDSSTSETETETDTTETDTTETDTGDPYCGDGSVDPGEECDNGRNNADDAECTSMCKTAVCGDGLVHIGVEQCDDANPIDNDECSTDCVSATCGDGLIQPGEQCDDANMIDTDFCTSLCQNATCGDGFVHANFEECDDGNGDDTDECTAECKPAVCGDGFVQAGVEQCDDGNDENDDECVSGCVPASCGDGHIWKDNETCDDGNLVSDDGCDSMCQAECDGLVLVQNWNGWRYYKVPVMGTMTDTNIEMTCAACGLTPPCQGPAGCNYNDNICTQTNNEQSCGNPMLYLAQMLCGGQSPPQCMAVWGIYQYMGHKWVNDAACGAEQNSWCSMGTSFMNKHTLCVGPA